MDMHRLANGPCRMKRMKNWVVPAVLLGLAGLGLVAASERAREQMRGLFDQIADGADSLGDFSKFCDEQLGVIQNTLDHLAQALEEEQA